MSRVQLALNVDDLEVAIAFYTKLFGTEPAKTRPGYANFAVADPPLKLVLLENPGQGGTLNHLGIEVASVDDGRRRADPARRARARLGRRARHHLLLRQAGQVLGRGHARTASAGRSTPCSPTARRSSPSRRRRRRAACCGGRREPTDQDDGRAGRRLLLTPVHHAVQTKESDRDPHLRSPS